MEGAGIFTMQRFPRSTHTKEGKLQGAELAFSAIVTDPCRGQRLGSHLSLLKRLVSIILRLSKRFISLMFLLPESCPTSPYNVSPATPYRRKHKTRVFSMRGGVGLI